MTRFPLIAELMRQARQPARSFAANERPDEPKLGTNVWYRGWECGYDDMRGFWTPEGYAAYKGGVDLDAPQAHGKTWAELLEAIDDEEDD